MKVKLAASPDLQSGTTLRIASRFEGFTTTQPDIKMPTQEITNFFSFRSHLFKAHTLTTSTRDLLIAMKYVKNYRLDEYINLA